MNGGESVAGFPPGGKVTQEPGQEPVGPVLLVVVPNQERKTMTRVSFRAWLGVVLAAAVLFYIGCSSSDSTHSGPGGGRDVIQGFHHRGRHSEVRLPGWGQHKIDEAPGQLAESRGRAGRFGRDGRLP